MMPKGVQFHPLTGERLPDEAPAAPVEPQPAPVEPEPAAEAPVGKSKK